MSEVSELEPADTGMERTHGRGKGMSNITWGEGTERTRWETQRDFGGGRMVNHTLSIELEGHPGWKHRPRGSKERLGPGMFGHFWEQTVIKIVDVYELVWGKRREPRALGAAQGAP